MELTPGAWDAVWQAAILGIVQGVTEFLPVSSTGHLILIPALFGWHGTIVDRLDFDVALHVGTLAALLAVFWRDWVHLLHAAILALIRHSLDDPAARLASLIILATLPAGFAGLLLQRQIETALRSPFVVGVTMVGVALLLALADGAGRRARDEGSLGPLAALAVGLAQATALVPGVSRSGSTIAAGLAVGLTRTAAARFSFLLSTPILVAAIGKQAFDVAHRGVAPGEMPAFVVGMSAAAVAGYLCIRALLRFLRTRSLWPFVVYRIVVGSAIVALAVAGRL